VGDFAEGHHSKWNANLVSIILYITFYYYLFQSIMVDRVLTFTINILFVRIFARGTCAGMILLAERCVGTSAVIENGQSLIGGMDILVCRNYFGSQISSFEMATPPPPHSDNQESFPGVFIRAPAILSINNPEDKDMKILGKVVATPCRQASVVLQELEKKIKNGENVIKMGVVDALVREEKNESVVRMKETSYGESADKEVINNSQEEKKDDSTLTDTKDEDKIVLPGAAKDTNAREVICAVQKKNILCTAFHPEITEDLRWHQYFLEQIIMKK
jgi:5'-phosphate synthase pdxT subunit